MAVTEISVPVWWSNGHMMFARRALDLDHPENTYNYIKREYGVDPEDFGIENPAPDAAISRARTGEGG